MFVFGTNKSFKLNITKWANGMKMSPLKREICLCQFEFHEFLPHIEKTRDGCTSMLYIRNNCMKFSHDLRLNQGTKEEVNYTQINWMWNECSPALKSSSANNVCLCACACACSCVCVLVNWRYIESNEKKIYEEKIHPGNWEHFLFVNFAVCLIAQRIFVCATVF